VALRLNRQKRIVDLFDFAISLIFCSLMTINIHLRNHKIIKINGVSLHPMIDYQVYTLANGIRILHKHTPSPITHCCFIVNAGSRDEPEGKEGLAHFIEHLLFKETERRNTNQILNRLELVGADLNAYTTKEYTCIHASLLKQHLERTMDLFEDILFHSTFPEEEMEKERGVILDEIASYLDQPEEAIQDDFEELLFNQSGY
jgi:predicted Zn-dependent peptidase